MRYWETMEDFEAFLSEGGMVEPADQMPDRYREEVFRFIEMHANSELMGGLTERDWVPRAPGMKRKLVALAKTQDEIGHAHLLYMVAADLGIKTRDQMLEDLYQGRTKFHNVFHYQAHTWADQIAIAYLVDAAALTTQQAVFKHCSYGPYKRILRRIIAEEGFHMRHGEEMVLTLADGTRRQHQMFQDALERWWWPTMHFFGPPSDPDDVLLRWRIKSETNEALRDRYVQKFVPMLQDYGFQIPDPHLRYDEDRGRWVIGEIDWEPLRKAQRNVGPDSARRIGTARMAWEDSVWVREALEAAARRLEPVAA
ncbi:MAG: 1,2-phenylacetyl-CoA epoxidase subunit A [Actinomycetota bacterium]|nr:1,2-phenylacetyl-CoA epoxidase subunit A [Actinomycetota bacterium]